MSRTRNVAIAATLLVACTPPYGDEVERTDRVLEALVLYERVE